jgi:CRP-like cAMP-binding protein
MPDRRKSPIEPEEIQPHMCSIDMRLDILGKVPFFSGLSQREILEINRLFREKGYQPGEVIFYEGDPAQRLYVLASGKVKLLRHSLSGKDVLLDLLTPGEFFGSLSTLGDEEYPDTAKAQTVTCVLEIGSDEFRKVLDAFPSVTLHVLAAVTGRLKEAHERIRQLSAHSVEKRIAYMLLKLADKFGERQEAGLLIQVPLSRDDLAEMTGTTTETASRAMSQFQRDGLVESGRQWVAILDRQGLQSLLDEVDQ